MEFENLLILECNGATYGARFDAEGELELYWLAECGEWEKVGEE